MSGKFTEKQIKEIKKLYRQGWHVEYLSWEYETSPAKIQNIISGNYEYNKKRSKQEPYKPFQPEL